MLFEVPGMRCGHCKGSVEKAIRSVDDLAEVRVNLDERRVAVTSATASSDQIEDALRSSGYPASLVDP
ncbi:MAG: heavy-metal-associated domain-containing protein [Pseudomonadota bacterium]